MKRKEIPADQRDATRRDDWKETLDITSRHVTRARPELEIKEKIRRRRRRRLTHRTDS